MLKNNEKCKIKYSPSCLFLLVFKSAFCSVITRQKKIRFYKHLFIIWKKKKENIDYLPAILISGLFKLDSCIFSVPSEIKYFTFMQYMVKNSNLHIRVTNYYNMK